MRRREFIGVLGGAAALWPLVGIAQQGKLPTIGVLVIESPGSEQFWQLFQKVMRELSYVDGQSIRYEFRSDQGQASRLPELAAKQLGLLVEAFPDLKPIAALWEQASAEQFDAAQRAAQFMHIELRSHKVENLPFDFDAAFRAIAQDGSRMVLVLSGPTFSIQRAHIAD